MLSGKDNNDDDGVHRNNGDHRNYFGGDQNVVGMMKNCDGDDHRNGDQKIVGTMKNGDLILL